MLQTSAGVCERSVVLTSFIAMVIAITLLKCLLAGDLSAKLSINPLSNAAFLGRIRADSLTASPPHRPHVGQSLPMGTLVLLFSRSLFKDNTIITVDNNNREHSIVSISYPSSHLILISTLDKESVLREVK